ncbi:MAG: hypothetical protein ACJ76Z_14495 [Thermoleophilaceae bacterium]
MTGNLIVPQPQLSLAGRPIRSATRFAGVGAYVVVVSTALESAPGVELESTYVGHDHVAETHVTYLLLAPSVREIEHVTATREQLPVLYARRRCLYDHLQRLQDFADELGIGPLQADVLDETLVGLEA